jgi:hypothetical protein
MIPAFSMATLTESAVTPHKREEEGRRKQEEEEEEEEQEPFAARVRTIGHLLQGTLQLFAKNIKFQ